ncbi:IS5 family transposase [Prosthecomicrobium pneumaticum]|uniref:IS5 family transposase n=1 Tax=Prosthecomicrobium pneumaticum TaxID=81895 RepID=UPI003CCD771F
MVRGRVTDEEWAFFAPFLVRVGPRSDHRLILDAIFWIARMGALWRDLDAGFPKWTRVYRQFGRWTLAGVWDVILDALNESGEGQDSVQMIDSTIVRAHQHSAGAKKGIRVSSPSHHDIGRSRGGLTTKIHLRANGFGLPVALVLTPGEASDAKGYKPVTDEGGPAPRVLIADKGYDSDAIREDLRARGAEPVIPMKRNRLVQVPQVPVDGFVYALRNRIERCFNRLKNARRVATRYDKTSESHLGFALIGAIRIWIRNFVNKA